MQRNLFTSANRPKFHDSMLIVKIRADAGPAIEAALAPAARRGVAAVRHAAAAAVAAVSDVETLVVEHPAFVTPGLNLLEKYERGGLIRRITALTPMGRMASGALTAARGGIATMAMGVRAVRNRTRATAASAGVSLVELEREEDTVKLQKALADDPHVQFVSRVPVRYLLARPAVRPQAKRMRAKAAPPSASSMWNLEKIEWAKARRLRAFKEATDVSVAVLDSGIDATHPDLAGRIASYVYLHPDTPSISGQKDIIGHGTHVAGTIGALIRNRLGINGICKCKLHAWKIFPDQAEFSGEDFGYFVDPVMYRRALADCLEQDIDVINLSIGGPGEPDQQEQDLFDALLANGTTIVAAMGNEREEGSPISFPAAIPGVIAVGATSITDRITQFSNRGDHISLCAPGKGIWSTLPTYPGQFGFEAVRGPTGKWVEGKPLRRETDYDDWDGTSMASPHVAAAVALLVAKNGKTGPGATRTTLIGKLDAVPAMGGKKFDSDYGHGRLNLARFYR